MTLPAAKQFEAAWLEFCEATADAIMPEATFQAWFAHFLVELFGLRRVVREPDFNPRQSRSIHASVFNTSVHLDIVVCRDDQVKLPRRAADQTRGPGGWDSLTEFDIISELKVGSSTKGRFGHRQVAQDYQKLSMCLDEAEERGAQPLAFMCVLDNHPTKRANPDLVRRYSEGCRPEIRTLWYSTHGEKQGVAD